MEKSAPPPYAASAPNFETNHQKLIDFGEENSGPNYQHLYNCPSPQQYQPPQPQPPPPTLQNSTHVNVSVGKGCVICGSTQKFTGTFTGCGWLLAICCFPCGIICCLCMRKKKCRNCGYTPS